MYIKDILKKVSLRIHVIIIYKKNFYYIFNYFKSVIIIQIFVYSLEKEFSTAGEVNTRVGENHTQKGIFHLNIFHVKIVCNCLHI